MAQFSGTVKLTDLNDFIAPSQACVVSLQGQQAPDAKPPAQLLEEEGKVQLHAKPPGGFQQTFTPGGGPDGPVKVSLNDCLACSGCVTSAETVLLESQSVAELAAQLMEPGVAVVITVSPQSRASLAALHGLTAADVQARLTTALRRIGAAAVLDTGVGREMALAEAAEEFLARYQRAHAPGAPGAAGAGAGAAAGPCGPLPMLASACPGWVCYAEKTQAAGLLPHISSAKSPQAVMGSIVKRHLAALRGWDPSRLYHASVMPCYDKKLEAARTDFKLPGTAVAEVDCSLTTGELQQLLEGWGAGDLAQVEPTALDSLLPDSELAAAAPRAGSSGGGEEGGGAGSEWERRYAAAAWREPPLHGAPGGSGGYLEAVARSAAAALLGPGAAPPAGGPLALKVGRNADFRELTLSPLPQQQQQGAGCAGGGGGGAAGAGPRPLRFAAAYGFRNIQSLVRKIKLGRCDYDYVEVMACPGGCLNGGGQAKPRPGQSAAALLDELEGLYYEPGGGGSGGGGGGGGGGACSGGEAGARACGGGAAADGSCGGGGAAKGGGGAAGDDAAAGGGDAPWAPALSATARALYRRWVGGGPGSEAAAALLHTGYHHREKTALGTVGDW
ncbi:MAG: iron hydrogenase [Monoraphidium minutum]|nr:MAG: iron hydrogenase [Monoraphidium minutum]